MHLAPPLRQVSKSGLATAILFFNLLLVFHYTLDKEFLRSKVDSQNRNDDFNRRGKPVYGSGSAWSGHERRVDRGPHLAGAGETRTDRAGIGGEPRCPAVARFDLSKNHFNLRRLYPVRDVSASPNYTQDAIPVYGHRRDKP